MKTCKHCQKPMKRFQLFTSVEYKCVGCVGKPERPKELEVYFGNSGIMQFDWTASSGIKIPQAKDGDTVFASNVVGEGVRGALNVVPVPKFKAGDWVRLEGVTIFKVIGPDSPTPGFPNRVKVYSPYSALRGVPVETASPALPKKGEWWEYTECKTHQHLMEWIKESPYEMKEDATSLVTRHLGWSDYAACGCLSPHNFGHGPEKTP